MATVLAKVRPFNNYGGNAPAGTVIEVDAAELERIPWCLERVGDALPPVALADAWGSAHSPDNALNDDGSAAEEAARLQAEADAKAAAEEAARLQAEADAKAAAVAAQSKGKQKGK